MSHVVCSPFLYLEANFTSICEYVSENSDICEGGGYVRWTRTKVCTESSTVEVVVVIASLVFFAYLFILLSATADDFFCENIACIVEHHGINQNTAGVTLMAFGNGSPDIFSSIASVMSVKNPQAGLAIGGLLGGSIFVTTVVVGSVIIIKPFDAARAPAIRDIGFHLVALGMLIFVVLFDGEMYWWQPFSFLVLYAIYALTVVSEVFPNKSKAMKITTVQPAPNPVTTIGWMGQSPATIPQINVETASIKSGSTKSQKSNVTIHSSTNSNLSDQYMDWPRRHLKTFGKHFNPFDMAEFRDSKWFLKAYHLVKTPCKILLRISIPLASAPWYKPLVITHAFVSPLAFCFAFQLLEFQIASGVPGLWFFTLVLSIILSVLIIIFTKWNQEPKYYKQIAAYTGFIMSIAWIYTAAAEIVDVVMMFGSLFDISYQILGLTAVSWCNAIGDVIADIGSARHGFNQMAFSAALGGPLFNLLVGFGSTFLIPIIQGKTVTVSIDGVKVVMLAGLATSLLSTLLLLFAQKFRPRWPHGVLLYVLYVVFLIFALLANQHVWRISGESLESWLLFKPLFILPEFFKMSERFGIVPLCLLWERNQLELLDEMIGSGINAILIKVAAMGLNSEHLSKNLQEMKEHLLKMHEKYGSHVCGEGGVSVGAINSTYQKERVENNCIETLVQSSVQTATQAFDSRTQTNLFEQCKAVIEAQIQFFFAVKDSVGNLKAVGMHSIVEESAEQLAIAVGDLQRNINLLDSDAGGIHGIVDSISRSISLADQTRQTPANVNVKRQFVNCARGITSTTAALIHAVKKLGHSDNEKNRTECSEQAHQLSAAAENLEALIDNPEFGGVPARISQAGRDAQRPVVYARMDAFNAYNVYACLVTELCFNLTLAWLIPKRNKDEMKHYSTNLLHSRTLVGLVFVCLFSSSNALEIKVGDGQFSVSGLNWYYVYCIFLAVMLYRIYNEFWKPISSAYAGLHARNNVKSSLSLSGYSWQITSK